MGLEQSISLRPLSGSSLGFEALAWGDKLCMVPCALQQGIDSNVLAALVGDTALPGGASAPGSSGTL